MPGDWLKRPPYHNLASVTNFERTRVLPCPRGCQVDRELNRNGVTVMENSIRQVVEIISHLFEYRFSIVTNQPIT